MKTRWMTIFAFLSIFLFGSQGESASTSALRGLRSQFVSLSKLRGQRNVEKQKLLLQIQQKSRELAKLNKDIKHGGLLAIPARLRLPFVRSKAQKLAQKMSRLQRVLRFIDLQKEQIRKRLVSGILRRYRDVSKKKNVRFAKEKQVLRTWLKRLSPKRKSRGKSNIHLWKVHVDPLDGPEEISQKQDVLKDIEDRINKRLKKLRSKQLVLKKKIHRTKRDQKLANDMNEFEQQDSVFDEVARSPRVVRSKLGKSITTNETRTKAATKQGSAPTKADSTDGRSPTNAFTQQKSPERNVTSKSQQPGVLSAGSSDPSLQQQRMSDLPGTGGTGFVLKTPVLSGSPQKQLKTLNHYEKILRKQLSMLIKKKKLLAKYKKRFKKSSK